MITARAGEDEKVNGLLLGAEGRPRRSPCLRSNDTEHLDILADYLPKPFSSRELGEDPSLRLRNVDLWLIFSCSSFVPVARCHLQSQSIFHRVLPRPAG